MKLTLVLATCATALATCGADNASNGTDAAVTTTMRRLAGNGLYRMSGVDMVGKDIGSVRAATVDICFLRCLTVPVNPANPGRSTAVTMTSYNGGTCWCKATNAEGSPTAPNADADTVFYLKSSDKSVIWSATREGMDMAGHDLGTTSGADMSKCMAECDGNQDCYAVVWTSYEGGTCWLKRRASAYVAMAGAKSAYVARSIVSSADA